ncbi:hypothetical protein F5Y07DRAFT_412880 [Xylaria sp. FL0933]|nr:hypothetical protein F5Y07DRAFT_412880 [Xylaria sp. FL0933]
MASRSNGFVPSRAAQERGRAGTLGPPDLTEEERDQRQRDGISPNYRGNPNLASNKAVPVPDSNNCHLYVTGFPRDITVADLMETLEGHGPVLKCCIEQKKGFTTASANILYFCHKHAEDLMILINNGRLRLRRAPRSCASTAAADSSNGHGHLSASGAADLELKYGMAADPAGHRNAGSNAPRAKKVLLRARWNNRGKTETELELRSGFSRKPTRVLVLKGTPKSMKTVDSFMHAQVTLVIDRVIHRGTDKDGKDVYEYRFSSWLNMVDQLVKAFRKLRPDIKVDYGEDPCAIKPTKMNGDARNREVRPREGISGRRERCREQNWR